MWELSKADRDCRKTRWIRRSGEFVFCKWITSLFLPGASWIIRHPSYSIHIGARGSVNSLVKRRTWSIGCLVWSNTNQGPGQRAATWLLVYLAEYRPEFLVHTRRGAMRFPFELESVSSGLMNVVFIVAIRSVRSAMKSDSSGEVTKSILRPDVEVAHLLQFPAHWRPRETEPWSMDRYLIAK